MAGTITSDLTAGLIDNADALGTWLVVGTAWAAAPAASTDVYLQGTAAMNANAKTTDLIGTRFASVATATNLDLTVSERHLFFWIKVFCLPALESKVRGGLGIYISSDATPTLDSTVAIPWDGPTNSKVWFVSGKDFEPTSGWVCYVVDPQGTPNQTLGTPVMSTVNRAGIRAATLLGVGGGAVKPKPWIWDKMAYGTGLTIIDGTAGTPVTFADIVATDSTVTNSFGVLTQTGGIFYCAGKMIFGTTGQTAITYFKDTNQVIVFQDFPVAATFYEIKLAGAVSFATTVQFGNFSGGLTSGGVTIRGASLEERRAIAPVIVAGGTGYTAGDILTISGGTFVTAAQIRVITVATGVITVARMETAGKYSVPPTGTLATTGGTGTGGTFTVTFVGGSIWTLSASAANQTLNIYGSTLSEMKSAALASTTTWRGNAITNSGTITANGSLIDNCTFQDLRTTAPISATYAVDAVTTVPTLTNCKFINCATALRWPINSFDTNGALNGTSFTSGGTGHAIEFTGAATSRTLTNVTFTGYSGTSTNAAVFVNIATGSMTLTIAGTGTDITGNVRTAGAAVTVVAGAVSVTITVKDINGVNIQNARVLLLAATGGPMPFDAIVTITRTGATATVTHTAHGMATNDQVQIKGANEIEYNGVYAITKIDANSYSYTVSGTPATPATGTIKATFSCYGESATLGLTDINGQITMSRAFTSAQPISGRVRKSTTGSSLYKTSSIVGTISSTTGFSSTILLVSDE